MLKEYQPVEGLWPSQHLPTRIAEARRKYADHPGALRSAAGGAAPDGVADDGAGGAAFIEHEVGNL